MSVGMTTDEKKQLVLDMMRKNLGIISKSCRDANITRQLFYVWCKNDPDFKQAVKEVELEQIDFVEDELIKKIKSGSEKSIHFYLKHKGSPNGYKTNLDITTGGEKINEKIQIEIIKGGEGDKH